MTWLRRLFGEPYDPEKDERVQALNAAAANLREKAEAARRRRNLLADSLLPPRNEREDRDATRG